MRGSLLVGAIVLLSITPAALADDGRVITVRPPNGNEITVTVNQAPTDKPYTLDGRKDSVPALALTAWQGMGHN